MSLLHFFPILKRKISVSFIFVISVLFLISCNKKGSRQLQRHVHPNAQQQAMEDSLARVQAKTMAHKALLKVRAQMSKKRTDTTAQKVETVSLEKKKTAISGSRNIPETDSSNSSGNYVVQISSWQSQKVAKRDLKKWKKRGYHNVYIKTSKKESTGDIWYRIRLGHFQTHSDAEQTGKKIAHKYGIHFWVSYVK